MIEQHYTLRQLSKLLGRSVEFWRIHSRDIEGTVKIGKAIMVPASGLEQYLSEHTVGHSKDSRNTFRNRGV